MCCGFVLVLGLLGGGLLQAQTGEKSFREGQALLKQGNLAGALKAYTAAAQADRANQQYLQQFMLVRQAAMLQDALGKEQNAERWASMAQALRSFYVSQGLHAQALPLDQQVFQRQPSANTAIQLAETQLALGQPAEAAAVLSGLAESQTTPGSQGLLAIALARQGKQAEARQVADAIPAASNAGPGTLYILARMQAALGNQEQSANALKQCFESLPPSRLEALKAHARTCTDFVALKTTAAFTAALATESKVPESKCSGGSSCANCPMRGNCSSGTTP
jgi:tetratricopeptide (TPR) repeat protein